MGWKALFLVLVCATRVFAQNGAVDVLHYRVEIALPPGGGEISASAELTVRPVIAPLEALVLDFGALAIDEVTVDGKAVAHEKAGERLTIAVPKAVEPFRVRIRYHGKPADGLIAGGTKHGDPSYFADNWPNRAHHWFPAVDHPSDKASVEFIVTAPARYDVVANGVLVEQTSLPDEMERTHWREATPIPPHCMVIGATEFAVVRAGSARGTEIAYWLYPQDRAHGGQFGRVTRMVEIFSELIGPYPYGKLALVQSSTRYGGMENAGAIFFDEKLFNGKASLEALTAHEVAHQWFGDSVSQRQWADVWLSEGFATYFAALFFERADGREAMLVRLRKDRADYLAAHAKGPRSIHDPALGLHEILSPFTYEKAAWVLHMLRGVVGDAAFFAGLRDYYAAYRDRNASTGELRVIMERHAGQPLGWFFDQWIYRPGHPVFDTKWSWRDGKVAVDVAQTQSGTLFRVPVAIEIRDEQGTRRENVVLDERREHFDFDAERKPEAVVVDPDEWVLREAVP